MVSAGQIREVISRYLSHDDANKLAQEFAAVAYNIHKNGDREAIELARAIEFRMADFSCNCISKPAFLSELRKLIDTSVVSNNRVFAQFSDPVNRPLEVEAGFRGWAGSSGTSPVVGFGSVLLVQS